MARPFIEMKFHASIIVKAYFKALEWSKKILDELAVPISLEN